MLHFFSLFSAAFMILMLLGCKQESSKNGLANIEIQHNTKNEIQQDVVLNPDDIFSNEALDTISIKLDVETRKKNKRYQGLYSNYIFAKLIKNYHIDTSINEVLFICKDGYSASVPFYQLLTEKGFIANKDVDAALQWDKEINDKFSPYYLVWDIETDDHNHNFPYGIIQIKIINKKAAFANAYPTNASPEIEKGFAIFTKNCIKCHAVNKSGGSVGPELNIPKSVVEYWKIEHIKEFIKNPANYRYNSKMPTLNQLTDSDIQSIIDYLTYMSQHKISE